MYWKKGKYFLKFQTFKSNFINNLIQLWLSLHSSGSLLFWTAKFSTRHDSFIVCMRVVRVRMEWKNILSTIDQKFRVLKIVSIRNSIEVTHLDYGFWPLITILESGIIIILPLICNNQNRVLRPYLRRPWIERRF